MKKGNNTEDIEAVRNFELRRYLGTWHEIVRISHFFERGLFRVSAEYTKEKDERIRVVNRGIRADGSEKTARGFVRFAHAPDRGELLVSFFRPFWSPYRIILLTEDYSLAAVTGKTRDYLWILSRTEAPDQSVLKDWLSRLEELGFDPRKFEFTQV